MFDPVSISMAISVGTKAFGALKAGMAAGKELQDMASQLGEWGKAVSDVAYAARKAEDQGVLQTLFGNAEKNAIEVFAAQKQLEHQRKELRLLIQYSYGPAGWDEFLSIEAKIRKQQQETVYRRAELMEALVAWVVGIVATLVAVAVAVGVMWGIGRYRGNW
jgi:hypothetical protein